MNTYRIIKRLFCFSVLITSFLFINCPVLAGTPSSDLLEQAKLANDNSDYDKAFDLAVQIYEEDAENPDVWLQMGIALQGLRKYRDAMTCFEKAISYAANHKKILSDIYMNLGTLYMEQNQTEKSLQAINKGLEIDKDNWHLYALRAHLTYEMDKIQAKKDLAKAEKMAPKDPKLFLEEAYLYFNYEAYEDALKAIEKAINLGGNKPVYYYTKGNIQEEMNDLKGATDSYIESILVGDFDYILPFVSLINQGGQEKRQIVLEGVKNKSVANPKLNGILSVLLDYWNEDGAKEVYDELVRNNDRVANHYFRIAKVIAENIPDNTARGVLNSDLTDNTARGVITQEQVEDNPALQILIVDADQVKNEVMAIDLNEDIQKDGNTSDQIFMAVEQPAEYPGGQNALMNWLSYNIRYPEDAQEDGIQGRSTVRFVVEKDGSISNVEIIRRNDPSLDAEALRVVKRMPKWLPGKNQGVPVRSWFTLPVTFRLNL